MYALCGVGLATFTMAWFGKKDYERIFSTVMMFGYLVASLGVPIMMKIYEVTGAFENVFVFGFIVCAIIIVCLLVGEKQSAKLPQETVEVAKATCPCAGQVAFRVFRFSRKGEDEGNNLSLPSRAPGARRRPRGLPACGEVRGNP